MALDYQHIGIIISIVLFVCFSHYALPYIHCYCIGACRKETVEERKAASVATIEVENQYKMNDAKVTEVFKTDKSVKRVLSMHFTFWTYAWFTYFVVTSSMDEELFRDKNEQVVCNVLGYINVPVFILFLWNEMFFSWESEYLGNLLEDKTCKVYIQELIGKRPVVIMNVVAYHLETKRRTVYTTGTDGNTQYHTEKYQERINDYEESEEIQINRWEDISLDPNTLTLNAGKLTRMKLTKMVIPGDHQTEELYQHVETLLRSKATDLFPSSEIDFTRTDDIPGFEERICAYWDADHPKKWWAKKRIYYSMSFFLMTWIYRIAFNYATQVTCFKVDKKIYAAY